MADRYDTVLLLGAPGSGKGTQGAMLGQIPGFHHLACGDVFRSLDKHSELGKTFLHYSTRGELVPDDLTVKMWAENVHARTVLSQYKPHEEILILDGIPRNVNQANALDEYITVHKIVHLMAKDLDAMVARMKLRAVKENRPDDAKEDVIRNRFRVYEAETTPVLEHYPAELIEEVDAMGTMAEVLERSLRIVAPVQTKVFA
ncbi:MAG: nucleoside monophosphate kinase [Phycisphaerales bacterium]|nr:nucleoside monophosphate kinase [Phycisphaerales bacterium]